MKLDTYSEQSWHVLFSDQAIIFPWDYNTSSIQVTWRRVHILFSAVNLNQKHESTQYLQPNIIQPADTWLTDEHIELLRLMVDNNKLVLPSHANATFSKNTICFCVFFYT